jgi:uncharacterized protein YqhQ
MAHSEVVARKAGGQAVFEGVMMRGDDRWAVAVRTPSGEIEVLTAELPQFAPPRLKRVPLLRGILALAEALPLGMRALRWSAVHGLGQPERKATPWERVVQALTIVVVVCAVVTIPAYATEWLVGDLHNGLVTAVVENVWSIGILVAYAAAVGRLSAVRRLFENHGAEHKVVAASEAGIELTPEACQRFSTRHVRCGTSLLLVIGVVSGIFYVLLGHHALPGLLASRVAIIPLVAAISAELQLRAAANTHRRWVRALLKPGLALQGITTREPSLAQLEVAIAAYDAAYSIESIAQPSSVEAVAVPV